MWKINGYMLRKPCRFYPIIRCKVHVTRKITADRNRERGQNAKRKDREQRWQTVGQTDKQTGRQISKC